MTDSGVKQIVETWSGPCFLTGAFIVPNCEGPSTPPSTTVQISAPRAAHDALERGAKSAVGFVAKAVSNLGDAGSTVE